MAVDTIRRAIIKKLHFPVDGYLYNVQIETSIDGGKNILLLRKWALF